MRTARQCGQATVEWIGLTIALALLLALVASWTARELRPPERPPAVAERVVDKLAWPLGGSPELPLGLIALHPGGDSAFMRAVKAAARRVRDGLEIWGIAQGSFDLGLIRGLGDYARSLWEGRGAGALPSLPDPARLDPRRIERDLRAWIGGLRRLPLREAVRVGATDAGRLSAGALTQVAEWYLRRRALKVLTERARRRLPQPSRKP